MSFIGTSINQSPTVAETVTSTITNGAGKAVKFDNNGQIVLCSTLGEAPIGILIMQTQDIVPAGDSVTIQVKDIGSAIAGGAFSTGDLLTVDVNGEFVKAATGNYISAMALSSSVTAGDIVSIEIIHAGYKA